jgi:hypothetical protein
MPPERRKMMKPEDIDKLYRDKFSGFETTPTPMAWELLQQRMQPQIEKKEEAKVRPMWGWYAVAACFVLFTMIGIVWKLQTQGTASGTEVAVTAPAETENEAANPTANQPETEAPVVRTEAKLLAEAEPPRMNIRAVQKAVRNRPAQKGPSTQTNAPAEKPKVQQQPAPAPTVAQIPETALAQAGPEKKTVSPQDQVEIEILSADMISSESQATAQASTESASSKAKQMLDQLRSLKHGQKPDLQAFGLANKVTFNIQTAKRQLSKTLNL